MNGAWRQKGRAGKWGSMTIGCLGRAVRQALYGAGWLLVLVGFWLAISAWSVALAGG